MAQTINIIARSMIATLAGLFFIVAAHPSNQEKPIRIGMANTFFYERSKGFLDIVTDDFKDVMKQTTGLTGELIPKDGPMQVAEKLGARQLDFGVFHAHEFAWMQKKFPDLRPLVIAADNHHVERAYVVVHKNSPAKTLADLKGKKLAMPVGTKAHCLLYLEKHCPPDKASRSLAAFFGSIEKSATPADALDDVARQKVQATVVDTVALEFYKEVKGPVFAKHLRILQQSESFPPVVLVYKQGALDEKTLNEFRDGMLKANSTDKGRAMMKTWNMDAFEPIPKDYAKTLADLLKRYPAPASLR
jgi:ABC-type phosphate/phosphonate transport system substrate-binding protein